MKPIPQMRPLILAAFLLTPVPGCHTAQPVGKTPAVAGAGQSQDRPQSPSAAAAPSWISVRDTYENAFSLEVPTGWKVDGGLIRPTTGYPHPYIDMNSPDGKTNVRLGDVTIPSYSTPNPWISTALQQQGGARVAAYATGEQFATMYGQARFGSMCQQVQLSRSGPRSPMYPAPRSAFVHITGGDANFTCMLNGQPMAGFAYAETMLVSFGGSGNWYVVSLASYFTPAAQDQATRDTLKHTAETIAFNPDWLAMQQKILAAATQINLQTAQGNMQAIKDTNERMAKWSRNMQQQSDNFNDILNGVTLTRDPASGVVREVPTGTGGQKWIDNQNHIGSGALSPGPGFHPLTTISR